MYLDLHDPIWPEAVDVLYAANVNHIMPASLLPQMFASPADKLFFYGPYKYEGEFTTASNADFDAWLKQRNPDSGIRDIETMNQLAGEKGYRLISDTAMPANNQFLVFQRD